jgi:7-cyano-7-deazaguanine reductase
MHRHPITSASSPLGQPTDYPERYDPALLFAMPRAPQREALGIEGAMPFAGSDFWTAYEITWLDARGKPQLAVGRFEIPADSPRLVESKSLKLYLASFAFEKLDRRELARRVQADLTQVCDAAVTVELAPVTAGLAAEPSMRPGEALDDLEVAVDRYNPEPAYLEAAGPDVEETLHSALFRSRCPVTGQPDYGDVLIRYRGPRIERSGLLRYLISYRRHAAFHEACVERIFVEVQRRCSARDLTVYAQFLRRGGIEINPFRSNFEPTPPGLERTVRQ